MGKFTVLGLISVAVLGLALAGPASQIQPHRGSAHLFVLGSSLQGGEKWNRAMLPLTVIPSYYNVSIRPILYTDESGQEWTAPGHVDITFEVASNATNFLALHRHPTMTINETSITVTSSNSTENVTAISYDDSEQSVLFRFGQDLGAGKNYTLSIDFVAFISEANTGLYRAYYTDADNQVRRMATTQFEAYGARRAFPCFDEPRFKTPFEISLGRKATLENYITLTNGRLAQASVPDPQNENWVYDKFEPTVPMPTYLVALIVTDFEYTNATAGLYDKPVRVYAQSAQIQRDGARVAADASARTLRFLSEKYDFPYEMPKMDAIAVPRDYFGPGAMENWGLVTYRDNYLMWFPNETTESNRQTIISVIAHEFAHQWFGDLVTCRYWTNIWLNEGFATYVATVVLQQEFKDYQDEREIVWGSLQGSMAYDTTNEYPIMNPNDELDGYSASGTIVYDKAGSVIRMMEGLLTADTLTNGLRAYLKANAYKTAVQDDLWQALEEQARNDSRIPADKTIKQVMDTWTTQPGYPVVRVALNGTGSVVLSQQRFGPLNATKPQSWEIPVAIATPSSNFSDYTPKVWLGPNATASYPVAPSDWIIVNPDAYGYYRVLYDANLTVAIAEQLRANRTKIGGLSRSQLVDDYFTFQSYGLVSIEQALSMTLGLEAERDFVAWYTLLDSLNTILNYFRHMDLPAAQAYFAAGIDAALDEISWDQGPEEHGTVVMYRARLMDWACVLETPGCVKKANQTLAQWQASPNSNPVGFDLQPVVYCAIVANGGEAGYNFTYSLYRNTSNEIQRSRLRDALHCATEPAVINRLLQTILADPLTVDGNVQTIVQQVATTTAGRQITFDFILQNSTFDRLLDLYGDTSTFMSIVSTISSYLTTEAELNRLLDFISVRDELDASQNSLRQSIQRIQSNIAWVQTYYSVIRNFFVTNASSLSWLH